MASRTSPPSPLTLPTQTLSVQVCACDVGQQATAKEATNGAADVNAWVSEVTRGMIKDLVTSDK